MPPPLPPPPPEKDKPASSWEIWGGPSRCRALISRCWWPEIGWEGAAGPGEAKTRREGRLGGAEKERSERREGRTGV